MNKNVLLRICLQHNATSWDNGCQKPPLLTPLLTPAIPAIATVDNYYPTPDPENFEVLKKSGHPPVS
jgi:hypothetical protein